MPEKLAAATPSDQIASQAPQHEHSVDMPAMLSRAADNFVTFRAGAVTPYRFRLGDTAAYSPDMHGKAFEVLDGMAAKAALVEDIGEGANSVEADESPEPALTVCVPVAVNKEDPERVARTVELIKGSQQHLGKPVEVLLWANAKYDEGDEGQTRDAARSNYQALRERLGPINGDGLRVQTALDVLPKKEATMLKLRADFMDALTVKAVERGYGFDHPVLWADADTTSLSPQALGAIEESVRNFEAPIVHTDLRYNLDWATGTPLSELDVASRAIAMFEMERRHRARLLESTGRTREEFHGQYPEEAGTAFALGPYLEGGGLDDSPWKSGMNESQVLDGSVTAAFADRLSEVAGKEVEPSMRPRIYLPQARMGVSARRIYAEVKEHGTEALNIGENVLPGGYKLASDREDANTEAAPISGEELKGRIALDRGDVRVGFRSDQRDDPYNQAYRQSILEYGWQDPTPEALAAREASAQRVDRMIDKHLPPAD